MDSGYKPRRPSLEGLLPQTMVKFCVYHRLSGVIPVLSETLVIQIQAVFGSIWEHTDCDVVFMILALIRVPNSLTNAFFG